jgi:hypothetical protein
MRSSPAAQPFQKGCVSGVGTGTGLAVMTPVGRAWAPLFNVIGGLNNGWRVAMTTLGHERGGSATIQHLRYEREFWELVETAREHRRITDPLVRQQLAQAYTGVQLMRFNGLRTLARVAAGRPPGPEASISKLFWSEYHKRLGEIAIGIIGADGLIRPDGAGYPTSAWQHVFLSSRAGTIYSGTSEIQRTIIGERALGLPKEPPNQPPKEASTWACGRWATCCAGWRTGPRSGLRRGRASPAGPRSARWPGPGGRPRPATCSPPATCRWCRRVELLAGVTVDRAFGPVLTVGLGAGYGWSCWPTPACASCRSRPMRSSAGSANCAAARC